MQDNAQEGKSKKELLNLIQIQEEELELLRAALELSEVAFFSISAATLESYSVFWELFINSTIFSISLSVT